MSSIISSRFLVIGSGIAGLQYALLVADYGTVNIVTKKESKESNTNYAQGGIASVMSPIDSFDIHIADTINAGDGLCNEAIVKSMIKSGPRLINRLIDYGVKFSKSGDDSDNYSLGREGGHSCNRILHSDDMTGQELENSLLEKCKAHENISIYENHIAIELAKKEDANGIRIIGCVILDTNNNDSKTFLAESTVLATGGCGKVYSYTSNPDIATGDGLAIAYRAGATLANLEFVQFHPTCLYHPQAKSFLISEAVRGEGAHLLNSRKERFMKRYHPLGELAPRDIVARAIDQEMKLTGSKSVHLDISCIESEKVKNRFPNLYKTCLSFGIDMTTDSIPVVPAAHYMCGGVMVNENGETSLPGLLAIGEVAHSGVHGANRLASNSLLEAVYFADQAAESALSYPRYNLPSNYAPILVKSSLQSQGYAPMVLEHDWDSVRQIMWDYVGIVRSHERLKIAVQRLRNIRKTVEDVYNISPLSPDLVELRNIALIAELIVLSADNREESRGLHYMQEHPVKSDKQVSDTFVGKNETISAFSIE